MAEDYVGDVRRLSPSREQCGPEAAAQPGVDRTRPDPGVKDHRPATAADQEPSDGTEIVASARVEEAIERCPSRTVPVPVEQRRVGRYLPVNERPDREVADPHRGVPREAILDAPTGCARWASTRPVDREHRVETSTINLL